MTPRVETAAPAAQGATGGNQAGNPAAKPAKVIRLGKEDFAFGHPGAQGQPGGDAESPGRAAGEGRLDAGRTVRSGYAYDFDSTDSVPPRDAARAAGIRAQLGDGRLQGIEGRHAYRFVKRAFDIAFSAAVLAAFSWLYLLVAIAVKIDDPKGPILFRQRRVTKGGREFTMYKFRSMCVDAEERLAELEELNEKSGPVFKIADDPRITRVGKGLRKLSLDELPQFVNVLKGDMSVVGPRPALPAEVKTYTDYQRQRLLVKGGMTCYWQTRNNRDSITFDEWVDLDLLYIRKCGVWTDVKLIIQTIGVVLTAQGS